MPSAHGQLVAPAPARAGVSPAMAAPAPANSAPSAVTVISGCSENASCGASTSEAGRARAVADEAPGRDLRRGRGDLAVGDAQQDGIGPGAVGAPAERPVHLVAGVRAARSPARSQRGLGRRWPAAYMQGCLRRRSRSSSRIGDTGRRVKKMDWCRGPSAASA